MASPHKTPAPEPEITARIRALALTMDEFTIADRLCLNVDVVTAVIVAGGNGRKWCARCNRTGRRLVSASERGAYLKAQIAGFADWSFVKVDG